MPQQHVEVVRCKLLPRRRPTRTVQERLALRYPWFLALWQRVLARLSPRSRLRQALLTRTLQNGLAAYDRGDIEIVLLAYDPDVEFIAPVAHGAQGTLGLAPIYRGREGYRELDADWRSAWGTLRVEPQELVDFGDRFLVIGQMIGRGRGSGVSLSQDVAVLTTLNHAGRVIREQRYFDHGEALKAVGLAQ
jgi:ketosteroid isomerase-like protein